MTKVVFLDTGVLGFITHPVSAKSEPCVRWMTDLLANDVQVCIPEICDYELRRDYVRRKAEPDAVKALAKLDALKDALDYVAIESVMMLKAADLWAYARSIHRPTADEKELDCDVVLAAQALCTDGAAEVATTNVGHLSLFLHAATWDDITH